MRVSVFGLGYVGAVSAGCLADDGHEVTGVDPVPTKVDLINRGQSPIVEKDIGDIIAATAAAGRLRATSDPRQSIHETELSFVCRLCWHPKPAHRQSRPAIYPTNLRTDRRSTQK